MPHPKFPATLEVNQKSTEVPPPEVPPPVDNNLKVLIEGVATLVARCGTLFEELSREKNQSNPLFGFLNGGDGSDYYKRKLWEARQKHGVKTKPLLSEKVAPNAQKMTAETRGNILGEKPLNRTAKDLKPVVPAADNVNLQFHLSDTFTEPASFVSHLILCLFVFLIYNKMGWMGNRSKWVSVDAFHILLWPWFDPQTTFL